MLPPGKVIIRDQTGGFDFPSRIGDSLELHTYVDRHLEI